MNKREAYSKLVRKIIDGTLLSKTIKGQWLFIVYIELLIILYITNRFQYEKIYMDKEKLKKEVYELKSEYISIQAKLMELSKESQVKAELDTRKIKLDISNRPPKIITINTESNE